MNMGQKLINTLSANPQNGETLKEFVGNLSTNCLSVFVHLVKLALKGLVETMLRKSNKYVHFFT